MMDISKVKAQIKKKQTDRIFYFTGAEIEVQRIYCNQIAKVNGLDVVRIDSVFDVLKKLKNTKFVQKNFCYVIRDDTEFMKSEKLWDTIDKRIGNNIVIFTFTSLDKRGKFYKRHKDTLVEFGPLKTAVLVKYIQKEISLSKENCEKLIELCENDYSRILLEVDKIKQFRLAFGKNEIIDDDAFYILLKDGAIYQPPKDAIFDFVDAVLKRQINAFKLLEECYNSGEATMVMLSVLFTNAKQVLQVQTCGSKDISKTTGLTGWQIHNAKQHINRYSEDELIYMLQTIRKCEKGIKTGKIDDDNVMEYLLVHTM